MNRILPTFLYIGANKSGSTWIFNMLSQHPEIFIPKAKDIQFFDHYYHHGMDWYASFFEGAGGYTMRGECSHDYFLSKKYAERIINDLGKVKLLACLRHPVDRLKSIYIFRKKMYLGPNDTFDDYIVKESYLVEGAYYTNLKPFYDLFGHENIYVRFFDELVADARQFIQGVFSFLGVDTGFVPPDYQRPLLPAQEPRFYPLAHLAYRFALFLRERGWVNFLGQSKHNSLLTNILYQPVHHPVKITPEQREKLLRYYATELERLPGLLGRDIPESWKQ